MNQSGRDTGGFEGDHRFFKTLALGLGVGGVGDFGGAEVSEDAFDVEFGVGFERGEEGVEFGAGRDSLAGHAGVDLDVDGEGGVGFVCRGEPVDVLGQPDYGGEVLFEDGRDVFGEERGHREDAGLWGSGGGENFADACTLGCVGDTEPGGSEAGEDGCAEFGGVAVGVGFDDGEDGGWTSGVLERVVVGSEALRRDLHPGFHGFYPNWWMGSGGESVEKSGSCENI